MADRHYSILGVDKEASVQEIRRAYYHLAKRWHPDVNSSSGAKERFQEISEAYRVLSDPELRNTYDHGSPDPWVQQQRRDYYRYGTSTRPPHQYAAHTEKSANENEGKSSVLDHFLFATLLFIGISAMVYGIIDLLLRAEDEPFKPGGLVLGAFFTAMLLTGWRYLRKESR